MRSLTYAVFVATTVVGLAAVGGRTLAPVASTLPPLPDHAAVAGACAGASNGVLLLAGGANFPDRAPWEGGRKTWHDAVYRLAGPVGTWQVAGRVPRAVAYPTSITTDGGLLCAGGSDAERHYADVLLLRWRNGTLETVSLPSLPKTAANAAGALAGSFAYVAGGELAPSATQAGSDVWRLDLRHPGRGWQTVPGWPGPARTLAVAGAVGGSFYLIGGVSLSAGPDGSPLRTYLRDAYRLGPDGRWVRLPDLPHPVAAAPSPAPVVRERLVLLGGDDGSRYGFQPQAAHPGFARDVLVFDTRTGAWASAGNVPGPAQVTTPAAWWQGAWVVPSGEIRPGIRTPLVRAYVFDSRGGERD